jgi:hypothetical protein
MYILVLVFFELLLYNALNKSYISAKWAKAHGAKLQGL